MSRTYFSLREVLLFVSFLFLTSSCQKEDFYNESHFRSEACYSAIITSIDLPENLKAGTAAEFGVSFQKPNPCFDFEGIRLISSNRVVNLEVCLIKPDQICTQVIDSGYHTFKLTFHQAGSYQLKYNGINGEESITINVF